jgi:Uma2 family endonuclease
MVVQTVEPKVAVRVTGEELAAMGEIGRCELVEGGILMHSPTRNRHGRIELKFGMALDGFVSPRKLGTVTVGEVGVYTRRNPDTVRGADVLFISNERAAKLGAAAYLDVAPDLIVEVLSPDDRWNDITQKLREYFALGVRLVWVADPDERIVYAYRALTDVREFRKGDLLPGDDVLPGFSVAVASLFED